MMGWLFVPIGELYDSIRVQWFTLDCAGIGSLGLVSLGACSGWLAKPVCVVVQLA